MGDITVHIVLKKNAFLELQQGGKYGIEIIHLPLQLMCHDMAANCADMHIFTFGKSMGDLHPFPLQVEVSLNFALKLDLKF